ncbi:MAG: AMP-binding protein [Neisseriaceae bacterium]|nr:MAG: AMP-binding protein [Neisseriaceae bacterium]
MRQRILSKYKYLDEKLENTYIMNKLFKFKLLYEILLDASQKFPQNKLILNKNEYNTYSSFLAQVELNANILWQVGLRPYQVVTIQIESLRNFLLAFFSCLRIGVIPLLSLPGHQKKELLNLVNTVCASFIITEKNFISAKNHLSMYTTITKQANNPIQVLLIDSLPSPTYQHNKIPKFLEIKKLVSSNDPGLMLVSGGTTGKPKVIARSHNDYYYNIQCAIKQTQLSSSDIYLSILPVAHNFILSAPGILGSIMTGSSLVQCNNPSPENVFKVINDHKVTITALVPSIANLWTETLQREPIDLSSIRVIQVGGARFSPQCAQAFDQIIGRKLQQVYGMAEGLICFTELNSLRKLTWMTQGKPMSSYDELKIIGEDGNPLPLGSEGELLVRGPYTIRGYYGNERANHDSFSPDGFYRTGDKVRLLKSGDVIITGRIKDIIIRAGENIDCSEIEELAMSHPNIKEAALVGLPDEVLGEKSCLVITGDNPPNYSEIRKYFSQNQVATFKIPDELVIEKKLPKTSINKIDKKKIIRKLCS